MGSQLAPLLVRRVRPANVMAGGLVLAAAGFAILAQVGGSHALPALGTGYIALSLGLAPVFTLATDLIVGAAPPERAGAAAAVAETSAELGGALGIAILGSIVTAVYHSEVSRAVPLGLPGQVADAARDTLAGALAMAQHLPGQAGADLASAARAAFARAFEATAVICAVIALVTAALTAIMLRHAGLTSEAEGQGEPAPNTLVASGAGMAEAFCSAGAAPRTP